MCCASSSSGGDHQNLIANRKSTRYVRRMSSIGFAPRAGSEVEQLRSAYRSLNDVARNLANAARCIKIEELKMADHHLRAAEWHLTQAKRTIAEIGQTKR
jgi:hypothetical protein